MFLPLGRTNNVDALAVRTEIKKRADWPSSLELSNLLSRHETRCGRCSRSGCRGGALAGVLGWPKTELNDGARVGDEFCLPAVIALEFLHGGFGSSVPMTLGLAREVAGFDQRRLDLGGTSIVDSALSCGLGCFRAFIEELRRGRAATSVARCQAWQRG